MGDPALRATTENGEVWDDPSADRLAELLSKVERSSYDADEQIGARPYLTASQADRRQLSIGSGSSLPGRRAGR